MLRHHHIWYDSRRGLGNSCFTACFTESCATSILYINNLVYSILIRDAQPIMHQIKSNKNQNNLDISNHPESQSFL